MGRPLAFALITLALILLEAAPSRAQTAPSATPVSTEEVQVRGARQDPAQTTFRAAEVRQIPGAFGDAFRAIEALPGVTPIVSGLPFFFVRGAPPGNTGYFLDGVRVPLLYHLGLGPSVIQPGLIQDVSFYPGGFPARFGRFAGGILSADTRPPAVTPRAEGNVRLFDAGALVETPIDGGRGSVLAGARYSYSGALLPLFAPDTRLAYWDYQTRATWNLTSRDQIGVFAFGSFDSLSQRDNAGAPFQPILDFQFHRVDLRYDRRIGDAGRLRVATTLGYDESGDDHAQVRDLLGGLRVEAEGMVAQGALLRGGADVMLDHYDLVHLNRNSVFPLSESDALYPARNDVTSGAWTDVVWQVSPRVEITPGVRVDVFTSRRVSNPPPLPSNALTALTPDWLKPASASAIPSVDPRLAMRVALTSRVSLLSTFGISHQPPAFFVPLPGLSLGNTNRSLQTSVQTSEGLELHLPLDITATTTAFLHNYLGLTDITATCLNYDGTSIAGDSCAEKRVNGRTFGAEVFLRRSLTRTLTGWVSYTLSRSTRDANLPGANAPIATVLSEFDRTHVLSVIGAYDLGRGFRAGARFYFYTGLPYSRELGGVPLPPYNDERLPSFWRIDLRLEKRWLFGGARYLSLVAEWMNATLNKEAISVSCRVVATTGASQCDPNLIGPITIPSIGVEGAM